MSTDPAQIRRDIEATREELSSDVNALADKVRPERVTDRVRGALYTTRDRVMGTASHAGETGRAKATAASHQMSEKASSTKAAAGTAVHMPRERTAGSPLAAGMIAFGLGAVVSSLLPRSQKEQQIADQARDKMSQYSGQAKQQAREAASGVAHEMRQPARDAATSVASTAAHSASALREQSRSAAHEVQGQTHEATEHARRR